MAAKGNNIIVTNNPRGFRDECLISGTPKPGTLMTIVAATEPVGGRFTYEPFNRDADGDRALIAILLPDKLQGKDALTAYADGDRGFLYFPLPGDRLNVLAQDVSGTGDDHAIGDLLIVDDGTGKIIATTGTPQSEPFQCLSTTTNPLADHLLYCVFTGY